MLPLPADGPAELLVNDDEMMQGEHICSLLPLPADGPAELLVNDDEIMQDEHICSVLPHPADGPSELLVNDDEMTQYEFICSFLRLPADGLPERTRAELRPHKSNMMMSGHPAEGQPLVVWEISSLRLRSKTEPERRPCDSASSRRNAVAPPLPPPPLWPRRRYPRGGARPAAPVRRSKGCPRTSTRGRTGAALPCAPTGTPGPQATSARGGTASLTVLTVPNSLSASPPHRGHAARV